MQVLEEENDHQLLMKKLSSVPALPFIEKRPDEKTTTSTETKEQPRISKKEIRKQRNEFLGKIETQERFNEKSTVSNETISEEYREPIEDVHSEHDGKRLMGWMSDALEAIRAKIEYCKNPPISDDPTENREIRKQIQNYKTITQYNDADTITDYIEGLTWYGKINSDVFGNGNYLLDETIMGYKEIYTKIQECKSKLDHDGAMRYLNKLMICAARPLVVDELLMKETEFEPSISDSGGVSSEPYDGEQ